MQGKKVVAAVSSLIVGVTAVFSCVPVSVQAEEGKVPEVVQEVMDETQGEEGQVVEDNQQKVESVPIDEEHFPDEVFREYVKTFDSDSDNVLSEKEIQKVIDIQVQGTEIRSLEGIECFPYLQKLNCNAIEISTLDLTKNLELKELYCAGFNAPEGTFQELQELKLGNKPDLEIFNCEWSNLGQLDVSFCPNLKKLWCGATKISNLDVSKNLKLEFLSCGETAISGLDVSKNVLLKELYCAGAELLWLKIGDNNNLEIQKTMPSIIYLNSKNEIDLKELTHSEIDIRQIESVDNGKLDQASGVITIEDETKPVIYTYNCGNSSNGIEKLVVAVYLTPDGEKDVSIDEQRFPDAEFRAYISKNFDWDKDNVLSEVEIENATYIYLNNDKVQKLKGIEYFPYLRTLYCGTEITELDVSRNIALEVLHCSMTTITELDVSNNKVLKDLACSNTKITGLDVKKNTELERLTCDGNQLRYLEIGNNPSLSYLVKSDTSINIEISGNTFNLKEQVSPNIDLTRITEVQNGTLDVDTGIITVEDVNQPVIYTYDCGTSSQGQEVLKVTLNLEGISINQEHFPDEVFRRYVRKHFDRDKDGKLSISEISDTTEIEIHYTNIRSLKGIEYFTYLQTFSCSRNDRLEELDVSQNKYLTKLWCSDTSIGELDVSKNVKLTKLSCDDTKIKELDVSRNTELIELSCEDTLIKKLDVSENKRLTRLWCNNTQIEELDVSKNTELIELFCYNTKIKKVDVSENEKLTWLWCDNTQIKELDVSQNVELTNLRCSDTSIKELNVSKNVNLINLSCDDTKIKELDVSKNTELTNLSCGDTQIKELDVSENVNLIELRCEHTHLKELDVSENVNLEVLWCYDSQIDELEVSENTKLRTLVCENTLISGLDVSKNNALRDLSCEGNELLYLNIGNNQFLYEVRKSDTDVNVEISGNTFNLKNQVNSNIDLTKIIEVQNGTLDSNTGIITVENMNQPVIYTYDCGISSQGQEVLKVTLNLEVSQKPEELNEVPVIQAEDKTLTVGEEFEPLKDVTATDKEDGDLTGKIEILKNTVNMEEAGTYEVTYQVTDSKGASSTKTIFVTVNAKMEEPTVPEVPDKPNDVTKPDKKPEMDSIVPETADVSNIGGMASMLMGSAGLLVVLFGNRRKK